MPLPTELHHAVKAGNSVKVAALIDGKADVNAEDFLGQTPLHYVAAMQHTASVEAIVEKLIAAGANVDASNDCNETPLDCADAKLAATLEQFAPKLVVTVHACAMQDRDRVLVFCTGLSGRQATLEFQGSAAGCTMQLVRRSVARELKIKESRIQLVLPGGQLLGDAEAVTSACVDFGQFSGAAALTHHQHHLFEAAHTPERHVLPEADFVMPSAFVMPSSYQTPYASTPGQFFDNVVRWDPHVQALAGM